MNNDKEKKKHHAAELPRLQVIWFQADRAVQRLEKELEAAKRQLNNASVDLSIAIFHVHGDEVKSRKSI